MGVLDWLGVGAGTSGVADAGGSGGGVRAGDSFATAATGPDSSSRRLPGSPFATFRSGAVAEVAVGSLGGGGMDSVTDASEGGGGWPVDLLGRTLRLGVFLCLGPDGVGVIYVTFDLMDSRYLQQTLTGRLAKAKGNLFWGVLGIPDDQRREIIAKVTTIAREQAVGQFLL